MSFPHAVWRNVCFRVCGEYVVCRRNWKIPGQTTDCIVELKTFVITRHDHAWLNNTIFPYTPLRTKQNENTKLVCASATPFTVRPPAAPVTSSRALTAVSSACSPLSVPALDLITYCEWNGCTYQKNYQHSKGSSCYRPVQVRRAFRLKRQVEL